MLRAAEFHIQRRSISAGRSLKASKALAHRMIETFGGRLPDEEYYFDELAKALGLERVSIGTEARKKINATVLTERNRMEAHLEKLIREEKLVQALVSKIDIIDTSSLNVYLFHGPPEAVVCEVGSGKLVVIAEGVESAEKLVMLIRT